MRERMLLVAVLFVFFVSPVMTQALEINVNLGYGELYVVHRNASDDWRVIGSFTADSTIEFAICDSGNYSRWLNNQTPTRYELYVGTSYSFNFTVPYAGDWYVVFSNGYSSVPNNLDIEVYYIDQTGTTQTQLNTFHQSQVVTPFIVAFITIFTVVCILGIWCARRKEPQPAVRYEELLSVPE